MEFRNIISLSMLYGFFVVILIILLSDIFIFAIEPSESKMAYLLVGGLVGYVATVITSIYKRKN